MPLTESKPISRLVTNAKVCIMISVGVAFNIASVWLILGVVRSSEGQSLERTALTSCGKLLVGLTSNCADSRHSNLEYCCEALQAWNSGLCWCETNAFNAASNLAMDYYAFQFRTTKCNLTEFLHPEITLPTAGKGKVPGTCPTFESLSPAAISENCPSGVVSKRLREKRMDFLKRLSEEDVELKRDVTRWSERIDTLLSPRASLFSIGMSFQFSRRNIKQYLLSRTTLSGGPLWRSTIEKGSLFWRASDSVSYSAFHSLGHYSFAKIEFVTFERCSPRISEIYSQEEEAVRLYKQFVYFEPTDRYLWKAHRNPDHWCSSIHRSCPGRLFPYRNKATCVELFRRGLTKEHVTCTRSTSKRSVLALHGDTSSCRVMYLDLASLDSTYCRFLGEPGLGRCRKSGCLSQEYNDVYREANPRFELTVGYTCSSHACSEDWPLSKPD